MSASDLSLKTDLVNRDMLSNQGYTINSLLSPLDLLQLQSFFSQNPHLNRETAFHSTMGQHGSDYKKLVDEHIKSVCQPYVDVLIPGYKILFGNFLIKEPGIDGSVGVHTDWSYVDESIHTSYNLWIPLVDTNEKNGCLHVWPESHHFAPSVRTTPYLPFSKKEEHTVYYNSKPMCLTAGQGIIYHSGIIHYSNPNRSTIDRPAIAMVLIPEGAQAMHYYRPNAQKSLVEAYEVPPTFFFNHNPQETPKQSSLSGTLDVAPFRIDEFKMLDVDSSQKKVSEYYNQWTPAYRETYGDVIQAYRPTDESDLLNYILNSSGIVEGQSIVDAGCGVCGPAVFFAKNRSIQIEAITISSVQKKDAEIKVMTAGLEQRINVIEGDFRTMHLQTKKEKDGVLFLESLGHSSKPQLSIRASYNVLKEGGFIYIKDFFTRESADCANQERINRTIQNINREYDYCVLDLQLTLSYLRKAGFVIDFVKRFDFESDVEIRKAFEDKHNISVFEGGEFVPAEWLEIRAIKHFTGDDR